VLIFSNEVVLTLGQCGANFNSKFTYPIYMKLHFLLEPAVFRRIRKIAKTTISLLPHRPHGTTRLQLERFSLNFIFGIFRKCVEKIQDLLKSAKTNEYFCLKTNIHF
jgi:hypothetical protein